MRELVRKALAALDRAVASYGRLGAFDVLGMIPPFVVHTAIKMEAEQKYALADEILGLPGRLVGGSKVMYRRQYPDNKVVFNANVCTVDGKIWFGDLDITRDEHKLLSLASKLGERIFVLKEHDGRLDNETKPNLKKSVWIGE